MYGKLCTARALGVDVLEALGGVVLPQSPHVVVPGFDRVRVHTAVLLPRMLVQVLVRRRGELSVRVRAHFPVPHLLDNSPVSRLDSFSTSTLSSTERRKWGSSNPRPSVRSFGGASSSRGAASAASSSPTPSDVSGASFSGAVSSASAMPSNESFASASGSMSALASSYFARSSVLALKMLCGSQARGARWGGVLARSSASLTSIRNASERYFWF